MESWARTRGGEPVGGLLSPGPREHGPATVVFAPVYGQRTPAQEPSEQRKYGYKNPP